MPENTAPNQLFHTKETSVRGYQSPSESVESAWVSAWGIRTGTQQLRVLFHADNPIIVPIDKTTNRNLLERISRQPFLRRNRKSAQYVVIPAKAGI